MTDDRWKVYVPQGVDQAGIDLLVDKGYRIVTASGLDDVTLKKEIADCDALFLRTLPVTRDLMSHAKRLKVISRFGVGVDNVDLEAAKELGIYVLNVPAGNITTVAEHTLAFVVACAKNFHSGDKACRTGKFVTERAENVGFDIAGKTLGLLGLGKIARSVAQKALAAFELEVIAYDPFCPTESVPEGVELVSDRDALFSRSDFVSVHIPVTDETEEAIGAREFGLMKKSAYFVNCSRGKLVREPDLVQALRERQIAGAAIDVFNPEPPADDNPLFELDNVILSPHNAGYTRESSYRMGVTAAQGIDDVLSGRPPKFPVVSPK